MVFTSSGTTGAPKLVVHTQAGIDAHAPRVADAFGYRAEDAVILCMLPLCGVFGFCTLAGALAAERPYVLLDVFDAERAAELIREHRVTHTNGSDEMFKRLLEHDTGTLREGGFAAFNLEPRPLIDAADARGLTLYQCYGTSEVQALVAHAPADAPAEERARAGGRPISDAITRADGRRRDPGPRPERDGRLPQRGRSAVHRRRLLPHRRPRPRDGARLRVPVAARRRAAARRLSGASARDRGVHGGFGRRRGGAGGRARGPRRSRSCSEDPTNPGDRTLPRRARRDSRSRAA